MIVHLKDGLELLTFAGETCKCTADLDTKVTGLNPAE
jgi:hypothetical protein